MIYTFYGLFYASTFSLYSKCTVAVLLLFTFLFSYVYKEMACVIYTLHFV